MAYLCAVHACADCCDASVHLHGQRIHPAKRYADSYVEYPLGSGSAAGDFQEHYSECASAPCDQRGAGWRGLVVVRRCHAGASAQSAGGWFYAGRIQRRCSWCCDCTGLWYWCSRRYTRRRDGDGHGVCLSLAGADSFTGLRAGQVAQHQQHHPHRRHLFHVCLQCDQSDHFLRGRSYQVHHLLDDGFPVRHQLWSCTDSCDRRSDLRDDHPTLCARAECICHRRG